MPAATAVPHDFDRFDLRATVAQLFVYPVKSCAGIAVPQATLTETGLAWDRAWMVVDAQGHFLTQRQWPRMALIQPQLQAGELVLHAPGRAALHVGYDRAGAAMPVQVWRDTVRAYDIGDEAARWFSDFLAPPNESLDLRLVRFDPAQQRLSDLTTTSGIAAPNQFADGFPLLVASEGSLAELNARLVADGHAPVGIERFRPNLVLGGIEAHDEDRVQMLHIATDDGVVQLQPVKPCTRCPIPDIDPATATSSPEVGDMLRRYRADPRVGGAITFGMNAIAREGVGQVLRVGQAVGADYDFG